MHSHTTLTKLLDRRLHRMLGSGAGVQINRLGEGQLLVRKAMIDSPAAERGMKSPARVPATVGYEIYVSLRPFPTVPAEPSQRIRLLDSTSPVAWAVDTMELSLEAGARGAEWELLRPEADLLTIRVRCGTSAPRDEINSILKMVEGILLRRDSTNEIE